MPLIICAIYLALAFNALLVSLFAVPELENNYLTEQAVNWDERFTGFKLLSHISYLIRKTSLYMLARGPVELQNVGVANLCKICNTDVLQIYIILPESHL